MLTSGLPEQECARLDPKLVRWGREKTNRPFEFLLLYPESTKPGSPGGEGLQNRKRAQQATANGFHTDASHLPSEAPAGIQVTLN